MKKLPDLNAEGKVVVDIGPGCSELPEMLIDLCESRGHTLVLVDSAEVLDLLPDKPFITKVQGRYPEESGVNMESFLGRVDVLICYSVLHYIFAESNVFAFLDQAAALLAEGGRMLVGDIPNVSKRKRFFASPAGVRFHQKFTGNNAVPEVEFNQAEPRKIDDAVVLAILMRLRASGFDVYVMPQEPELPMENRREDLLICRP